MEGVSPNMIVGVGTLQISDNHARISNTPKGTEVIAGEGLILTAGGIDTHVHFICPQQAYEGMLFSIDSTPLFIRSSHCKWHHNYDWRRHWTCCWLERNHMHSWLVL